MHPMVFVNGNEGNVENGMCSWVSTCRCPGVRVSQESIVESKALRIPPPEMHDWIFSSRGNENHHSSLEECGGKITPASDVMRDASCKLQLTSVPAHISHPNLALMKYLWIHKFIIYVALYSYRNTAVYNNQIADVYMCSGPSTRARGRYFEFVTMIR